MLLVVFSGINDFTPKMVDGIPAVTGIIDEADEPTTILWALTFHPATEHIFIIHDQSESGLANAERSRRLLEPRFPELSFSYITGLSFQELAQAVDEFPDNST